MFGLPSFICGLILVLLSKRTWTKKLIVIGSFILTIALFWPIWTKVNSIGPETFLIPKNYRGKVNVIYKKNCGTLLKKTKEGWAYVIPDDGILLLSNEQKYGIINQRYFLVDSNGRKTELPKMDVRDFNEEWTLEKNQNELPRDRLGVFHWGTTGGLGQSINETGEVTNKDELFSYQEFYISTYNDLKNEFGFKYTAKFDSTREVKLKNCR